MRPQATEYGSFFGGYIGLVEEIEILPVLDQQLADIPSRWQRIPEAQRDVVHAPYSWTVFQVLQHLNDGERVFGYRLLRIARGDTTPLPGFDEHLFATKSLECSGSLSDCIEEFRSLRKANAILCRSLPEEAWGRIGTCSDHPITVRALAYILVGHVRHHHRVLEKRCPVLLS